MQNKSLRTEVYEIEAILAKQQFLSEIIRDFGEYNSENSEIADKMTYLVKILLKSQKHLLNRFENFITRFQRQFK
ncbi:MAG: hypothetical protein MRZ62_05295 [Brachyspira sp.]|nr:hypothetical protein [Brachyspira sp.]